MLATGAAGITLLDASAMAIEPDSLELIADANASPPAGIEGVSMGDRGTESHGKILFGPLGFGALKLALHRACIARLFEQNDLVLDAEEIYARQDDGRLIPSRTPCDHASSIDEFLDDLASGNPTPGGGSAAAIMGAMGAALVSMVCNVSFGKKGCEAVEPELRNMLVKSEELRRRLDRHGGRGHCGFR